MFVHLLRHIDDEEQRDALIAACQPPPDLDHWGEGADAEAGQDAFMKLMGGGA